MESKNFVVESMVDVDGSEIIFIKEKCKLDSLNPGDERTFKCEQTMLNVGSHKVVITRYV